MKQDLAIKNLALRGVRTEGQRLETKCLQLKNQKSKLMRNIHHLNKEIKALTSLLEKQGLEISQPDFSISNTDSDLAINKI